MKKIFFLTIIFGLLSPAYAADSYKEQLRQFKLIYIQLLEKKVEKIPVNSTVEVFLKDGTSVRGTFLGYYPYSDALWIMPLRKRYVLDKLAFDIRQIQDVSIIVLRSI